MLLKALEKDRARRYETANGLARDIERYLADEVVEARPPTSGYRLRKFVRRHKGQVIAAGLVLLALLAGIGGTTFGLVRAERQREIAQRQKDAPRRGRDWRASGSSRSRPRKTRLTRRSGSPKRCVTSCKTSSWARPTRKTRPMRCSRQAGRRRRRSSIRRSASCWTARRSNCPRTKSRRVSPNSRFFRPNCSKRLAIRIVASGNTTGQ